MIFTEKLRFFLKKSWGVGAAQFYNFFLVFQLLIWTVACTEGRGALGDQAEEGFYYLAKSKCLEEKIKRRPPISP